MRAAWGSPRHEAQDGCWCYCGWRCCSYLRESSSSRARRPSPSQDPYSNPLPITLNLKLSADFKSPGPTYPIVAHLFYHLFNLICPLQKQGLESYSPSCSQETSLGASTILEFCSHPPSHPGPRGSWREQATYTFGRQMSRFASCLWTRHFTSQTFHLLICKQAGEHLSFPPTSPHGPVVRIKRSCL